MNDDPETKEMARKALDSARDVDARINAHERLCTERWEQARNLMHEISSSLKNQSVVLWTAAGGTIIVLLGIIGWLIGQLIR